MKAYTKSREGAFHHLETSIDGLSEEEAQKRLLKYGANEIIEKKKISALKIFIRQFKSFIVGILVIAMVISIVIGEYVDASIIGAILILNAVLGFVQEYRAEKSIAALKKLASLKAVVLRDGKEREIDAKHLVPGDVIVLETGEKIPADARIVELVNLQTQESTLTGESLPVKKQDIVLQEAAPVADRVNMIFSGTIITAGRGKAVISATGMDTEIGKIAKMIQETKPEPTPLQKKLAVLGEILGAATIVIAVLVFLGGLFIGGFGVSEMLILALSLAVAAIPEGLPAVVTISLALGIQRMIKRNALIRKLPSVETLGSTTVICTDKTGTLTLNQMTVRKIYTNGKIITVSGRGYGTEGNFYHHKEKINPKEISLLLKIGALCNDSKLTEDNVIGDPTEGALIVSAAKAGIVKSILESKYPRKNEIQFTSERKRMSTFHEIEGKKTVYTKGAPDVLLELCDKIYDNGKVRRLTREDKKKILKMNETFARHALRVLGFAYKENNNLEEKQMVFVGLQGMIDPPRKEVRAAIEKCRTAGIRVVMITGDHKTTAEAIGRELGLEGKAVSGKEIDKLGDLTKHVDDISIYARVDPRHKVMVLEALKANGHVVAMTGDGVNDAPALKKADIGIAMGITGTDVAKEASDMILTDDNFASIVNAVEEGRGIYDNIKKFVNYLLSSNLGEILVIFVALLIGMPLPLTALQILWINLVTDGPPALALGVDPASPNIMQRKPRDSKKGIITKNVLINIIILGVLMCAASLLLFNKYYLADLIKAQTMVFTTLVVLEIARIYMIRSQYGLGVFSNKYLLLAISFSLIMQLVVIYTPLNKLFKIVPLGLVDWGYILGATAGVFIIGMIASKIIKKITKEDD